MAETFESFDSRCGLTAAEVTEQRPVVLPFPTVEGEELTGRNGKPRRELVSGNEQDAAFTAPLIKKLCEALNAKQISYCHWKSNWKLESWLTGAGDLDLLVDRGDAPRFAAIVNGLGFKQAEPASDRQVPGIVNLYGFDSEADRFVHLHVHYQLVIGNDLTKNYHLPVENLCLEHASRPDLIPTPGPEFELILFVIRMVLKHSVVENIFRRLFERSGRDVDSLVQELDHLEAQIDQARLASILPCVAPEVDGAFFDSCLRVLRSPSFRKRMMVRRQLQKRLETCSRRQPAKDALLKVVRRLDRSTREHLFGHTSRKRFINGGLLIAVVGGDGAGKTTVLDALDQWLSKKFVIKRFHLGKPPRSLVTIALIVMLKIRRLLTGESARPERQVAQNGTSSFPGYIRLFRWVRAGRDRWRVYLAARRFATNGGIALCDRFPLPQLHSMECPTIARTVKPERRNALINRLLKAEANYYRKMRQPDLLIVLRVDPEVAVMRKPSESEHHVRLRSKELWEQNWDSTNAYVIDAGLPAPEVLAQAQSIIWSRL